MVGVLILAHVSPFGTVSVKATVPVNPFKEVIVSVVVADWPALTADGVLAATVKSGAGGPSGTKVKRHPHPMGLLLHCIAPYAPELGVFVQLPAGHQSQLILWDL